MSENKQQMDRREHKEKVDILAMGGGMWTLKGERDRDDRISERRKGERRVDVATSDFYEPIDTTTPLKDSTISLKNMMEYAEKRIVNDRRQV